MDSKPLRLITVVTVLAFSIGTQAQCRNPRRVDYINKYSALTIKQMREHRMPASIALAQGLLESGAGMSTLTYGGSDHFGVKCGSSWNGRTVRHDDDARSEYFRVYRNPRGSYEDHSAFLKHGAYCVFLFKLKITDYKGQACGLKKAGYATDLSHADRLTAIIEDYDLYKYNRKGRWSSLKSEPTVLSPHQVYIANGIVHIVAYGGDTFRSLGKEFNIHWKKLVKCNDLRRDYTLVGGDIIYLKKKKRRASKPYVVYIVRDGDSIHAISQKYAVRLKNLHKINRRDEGCVPEVEDRLKLRQTLPLRYIRNVLIAKECSRV